MAADRMCSRFILKLRQKPDAAAEVYGGEQFPNIEGNVYFYETKNGVLVSASITGLPEKSGECEKDIFAFHIHWGSSCSGNESDPFANVLMHYNPENCLHPYHAGDMPPLFGNNGYAFQLFLTNRFSVSEIIGKTVVIHDSADDFTTQPAGMSGKKIACGEIKEYR